MKPVLHRAVAVYMWVFLTLSFLVFSLSALQYFLFHPLFIGNDQSVYLAMGQLVLDGLVPYRDFFDFNAPLIIYLSALPAFFSRFLILPVSLVFDFFVYLCFFISCSLVLATYLQFKGHKDSYVLPFAIAGLTWMQSNQYLDLGQREHFFFLFYLPYLLFRALRLSDSARIRRGMACNILAVVIGFCALLVHIKPQLLIFFLVVELVTCYKSGAFSKEKRKLLFAPEFLTFLVGSLLYFLHFAFYPREAVMNLLNEAIPIYAMGFKWYENSTIACLVSTNSGINTTFLFASSMLLAVAFYSRSALLLPLVSFNGTAFAMFAFFSTNWTYRYLPVQGCSMVLLMIELAILLRLFASGGLPRFALQFLGSPLLFIYAIFTFYQYYSAYAATFLAAENVDLRSLGCLGFASTRELSPPLVCILRHSKPGDAILSISQGVAPGYPPVLLAGRRPGSRFLHGMHLPMLDTCLERTGDLKYKRKLDQAVLDYGEDIEKFKPALIFVQDGEIEELLKQRGFFEKFVTGKGYVSLGKLNFEGMKVFKRGSSGQVSGPDEAKAMVLEVLSGKDLSKVAAAHNVSAATLKTWVDKARSGIDLAVGDASSGGEISLMTELVQTRQKLFGKILEIEKLKQALKNSGKQP